MRFRQLRTVFPIPLLKINDKDIVYKTTTDNIKTYGTGVS